MAKKIVLIIFGSIALLGLVVAIVGFAMGGWPGSYDISQGQLVYRDRNTTVPLRPVPSWMAGWSAARGNEISESTSSGRVWEDAPNSTVGSPGIASDAVTFDDAVAATIHKLEIDIDAGYVVVQPGDTFALQVSGPMQYRTTVEEGTWEVKTHYDGLRSVWDAGWNRYIFKNGEHDLTTTFTFTVPGHLAEFELELGMGEATVTGISAGELSCQTDMGSLVVRDVSATEAEFQVDMGGIEATGVTADNCELTANMGAITFIGSVAATLDAECSMGSITATMPRPDAYSWKADVSLGGITIDGVGRGGLHSSGSGGNPKLTRPYFDLECGLGSIEIIFD